MNLKLLHDREVQSMQRDASAHLSYQELDTPVAFICSSNTKTKIVRDSLPCKMPRAGAVLCNLMVFHFVANSFRTASCPWSLQSRPPLIEAFEASISLAWLDCMLAIRSSCSPMMLESSYAQQNCKFTIQRTKTFVLNLSGHLGWPLPPLFACASSAQPFQSAQSFIQEGTAARAASVSASMANAECDLRAKPEHFTAKMPEKIPQGIVKKQNVKSWW